MKTALLAKAGLTAAAGFAALATNAATAHGSSVTPSNPPVAHLKVADGSDPSSTGCASGAYTAKSAYAKINGTTNALIELRYSPKCRTVWGRITTIGMPNCHTNDDWCGQITIHRNSDGHSITRYTPNGTHGVYTPQLNDSGVTSYAAGGADNGALSSYAKTGSY